MLAHHRLAADPGAKHHRMSGGFHRFEFFNPLLDGELFLVVVIFGEEVAVLATKVAAIGDVDGADGKLRQTKGKDADSLCNFAKTQ